MTRIIETAEAYITMNGVPNPKCCNVPEHLCPRCEAAAGIRNQAIHHNGSRHSGYSNTQLHESERQDYLPLPFLNPSLRNVPNDFESRSSSHRRRVHVESTDETSGLRMPVI